MRRAAAAAGNAGKTAAAAAGNAGKTAAAAAVAPAAAVKPRPRVSVKYEEQAAAASVKTAAAPPRWSEWYALIEKMREGRDAPVDMMGAGDPSALNRNPVPIHQPCNPVSCSPVYRALLRRGQHGARQGERASFVLARVLC
jgi:hypothetical protein